MTETDLLVLVAALLIGVAISELRDRARRRREGRYADVEPIRRSKW